MIKNKTFKIRIYPNKVQKRLIDNNIGACRYIYNYMLNLKIKRYNELKENLSYNEMSSMITELKHEPENGWIRICDSVSLEYSIYNLNSAFQNFFDGLKKNKRCGFPKFKSKKRSKLSYKTNGTIKVFKNKIKIPKIDSIKCKHSFDLSQIQKIVYAVVIKSKSDEYYINVSCEVEVKTKQKTEQEVGIDLGIKTLATLSDGTCFENPKLYQKYKNKIEKASKKISRKKYGSKNYYKQQAKNSKIYEKINRSRIDNIHKITTFLINNYDKIIIEDLDVVGMMKNKLLYKSLLDASFREIRNQLEYKSDWYGKELIIIGRFEPTSKKCSNCGNIKEKLDLNERVYFCEECNLKINRDLNASLNILAAGMTVTACKIYLT